MKRTAIIDLGTNTFHLFIAEVEKNTLRPLYKEKIAVKIGQNGISKGTIALAAYKRAMHTLQVFKTTIDQFEVTDVRGVATSAIRNAKNGKQLLEDIRASTGLVIEMISGDREAELIYYGVKAALPLLPEAQLMMDIGGGSVEFIIGTDEDILWRRSFEIGAQRLLDKFHKVDPIKPEVISTLNDWLNGELKALIDAIATHKPQAFIGCSGTFDTIKEIYCNEQGLETDDNSRFFQIPVSAFKRINLELIGKNREERLAIPGMVTMRVDMIVVASCLIDFVLSKLELNEFTACAYALKEGVIFHDHQTVSITD